MRQADSAVADSIATCLMCEPTDSLLVDARPASIGVRAPVAIIQALSALVSCSSSQQADAWIDVTTAAHHQFRVEGPNGAHLAPSIDGAIRSIVSLLNRLHLDHAPTTLHLHAAAATVGELAVLISGESLSGKSTLVAALCDRGLGYITDECVDVSPAGTIGAWHKPISLRDGGRTLVGPPNQGRYERRSQRDGASRPVIVIALEPDAGAGLETIDRADAIGRLIDQSLDFGRRRGDLARLAVMVSATTAYRLGRSNLDSMCEQVEKAVSIAESSTTGLLRILDLAPPRGRSDETPLRWADSSEGVQIDDRTMLFDRASRRFVIIDGPTEELVEQLRQGTSLGDLDEIGMSKDLVRSLTAHGFVSQSGTTR